MNDEQSPSARLCEWCGGRIRHQPATGRLRSYCRQSCRQRAYEERRQQERIAEALAAARYDPLPRSVSSRDDGPQANRAPAPSRDETAVGRPRRALRYPDADGQLPLPEAD